MSSARANASARNRRAGGNEMPPPQQMSGRPGQPQQQMQSPKLSISDAIALISLRLGRVEQIIQEIPMDRPSSSLDVDNEDVKIVDNEVFESILKILSRSRIPTSNILIFKSSSSFLISQSTFSNILLSLLRQNERISEVEAPIFNYTCFKNLSNFIK